MRVWQQEVGVMDGIGVLRIWHQDGRDFIHYFDADRVDEVAARNWRAWGSQDRYAHSKEYLHRLMCPGSPVVDHINRDTYDSRSCNLRRSTDRANKRNHRRVGPWGPCVFRTVDGTYQVRVSFRKGRYPALPCFKTPEQAMEFRDIMVDICDAFDAGSREEPTKEEMMSIADRIRRN